MLQIHAIDHAYRLRGDEVATGYAYVGVGHRGIGQSHGQQRLDLDPHPSCRFLYALHGHGIGQAYSLMVAVFQVHFGQMLLDLRTCAMYQHQSDAQRGQQVEIVRQFDELAVGDHFAAECDDERLATEAVDIGRYGAEPGNEIGGIGLKWHV